MTRKICSQRPKGTGSWSTWRSKKPLLCSKGSMTNQISRLTCLKTKQKIKHMNKKHKTFPPRETQAFPSPPACSPQKSLSLLHSPALSSFPREHTSLPAMCRGSPRTPPVSKGKEKVGRAGGGGCQKSAQSVLSTILFDIHEQLSNRTEAPGVCPEEGAPGPARLLQATPRRFVRCPRRAQGIPRTGAQERVILHASDPQRSRRTCSGT